MSTSLEFMSTVEHLMDAEAAAVSTDSTIQEVRAAVNLNGGRPVAVLSPQGRFAGVIKLEQTTIDSPLSAGRIAKRPGLILSPNESAFTAVKRMLSSRIDWAPVVTGDRFVGAVSRDCVRAAFGEVRTI